MRPTAHRAEPDARPPQSEVQRRSAPLRAEATPQRLTPVLRATLVKLAAMLKRQPPTVKELAEARGLTTDTMHKQIHRLDALGLIRRSRAWRDITITEKGKKEIK